MRLFVRLLGLYRPYWTWVAGGIVVSLLTTLANIALMATSGWFITAMGVAGAAGATMNYFTPAAVIRGTAILRTGGRYVERLITHEATFRHLSGLRRWVYDRLEPLAPAGLEGYHTADVAARLNIDVERLQELYLRVLVPTVGGLAAAAICVWVAATYAPGIGLALGIGLGLAGIVLPLGVGWAGRRHARAKVTLAADLHRAAVDQVQGLAELQAFGADAASQARFLADAMALERAQDGAAGLDAATRAGTGLLTNLALWSALALGLPLVAAGTLERPDYVMLAFLSLASFEAVAPLPAAFRALPETFAAARRLFAIADTPPPPGEDAAETAQVPALPVRDLAVTGLRFGYGDAAPVIDGLDLFLGRGEKIALVGPSGVGKSTLIALLTGLRRLDRGTLSLGGKPRTAFSGADWRRAFAVAPQDVRLFTGTLRENLTLGAPEADDAAILAACRTAQLEPFLAALPDGLDTHIGEAGVTVSGGEARRIGIARALLKPAPILILDEPTEGLDPRMEAALLEAVFAGLDGRSLILISHRRIDAGRLDRVITLG